MKPTKKIFIKFEKKLAMCSKTNISLVRFKLRCPVRLAWSRTLDFHSSDRGSNPLRDAIYNLISGYWTYMMGSTVLMAHSKVSKLNTFDLNFGLQMFSICNANQFT